MAATCAQVSKAFAIERAAELAQMALEAAATITLQRYWRGYVAREVAGDRREEMLLFLEALKRQEAKTMEREYYKVSARVSRNRMEQFCTSSRLSNIVTSTVGSCIRWRNSRSK